MQSQSNISPTATPYQSSPIETEQASLARSLPRDWSVWLLPVAGVLLALSAYGVYALPTNFDLLVPLRILVLLCVALLAFIWLRTRGLLSSASNKVVTYKRDGAPIIWNPTLPIGALFNIGLISAVFGALEFWTARLDSFDFSYTLTLPFTSIATSALLILFASLLWLSRFPALDYLLRKRLANRWVLLPILIVCFGVGSLFAGALSPSIYTTSFASWPSTVNLVSHAAAQIDKDAVVEWVVADTTFDAFTSQHTSLKDTVLEMSFYFVSPNRSTLVIRALDTNPPRLESIDYTTAYTQPKPKTQASLDALSAKLAYVTIGPRDVYFGTQNEASAYANGKQFTPSTKLLLPLNYDWQTQYGALAGWQMFYYDPQAATSENPPDTTYLLLYVDGNSGAVVAHNFTATYPPWPGR